MRKLLALLGMVSILASCGEDSGSNATDGGSARGKSSAVSTSSDDVSGGNGAQSSSGGVRSSSGEGVAAKSSGGASSADVAVSSSRALQSSSSARSSSSKAKSSSSSGACVSERREDGSISYLAKCCDGDTAIYTSPNSNLTYYYTCRNSHWSEDSIGGLPPPPVEYPNMDDQFKNRNLSLYDLFTDPRDGRTYRTITIRHHQSGTDSSLDDVYTFFAENLNYGKQILSTDTVFDDGEVEKLCYNDDPWYCENGFGGLYSWSEAMGFPKKYDSVAVDKNMLELNAWAEVQGICPDGWHITNENEWGFIRHSDDTYAMQSKAAWKDAGSSNNRSGISVLPSGTYSFGNFYYGWGDEMEIAKFWHPNIYRGDVEEKYGLPCVVEVSTFYENCYTALQTYYMSLRCTKNEE